MIYGCLQPRELWFIDFNHVHCSKDVRCAQYMNLPILKQDVYIMLGVMN